MRISKKTQYGLRALVYLAQKGFASIREISKEERIPYYYLEKIFNELEKAELVLSKKGSLGGYSLKKKKIKLSDLFEALGEKTFLVDCFEKRCFKEKKCLTKKIWRNLQKKQDDYFNSITVQDLL